MPKNKALLVVILLLFVWSTNHSLDANAASFSTKINEIRKQINKDNVKEATRLLSTIKVATELEQNRVNLLFGDIYLKIKKKP